MDTLLEQPRRLRKMIKITNVLAHIPYSRTQIYDFIAAGTFPKPIHLGGRAAFWIEGEVAAWLEAHIEAERKVA
jgi:prophage regulatory protein